MDHTLQRRQQQFKLGKEGLAENQPRTGRQEEAVRFVLKQFLKRVEKQERKERRVAVNPVLYFDEHLYRYL